ncbi:hypothetical protein EDB92DRAFT_1888946 [Lactarius akahatsu]|uniref:Cytochrome P450 n=1 Tax=Lactarius akahatsu TaxID=416441 RepID=A0AAD4Q9Y1_9AGAM|nr:hypothetical protein EDB92DRAFT_1888946 [Lactarius akahatsu]
MTPCYCVRYLTHPDGRQLVRCSSPKEHCALQICHHDPSTYGDDAAMFQPERFLDASSETISGPAETHEEGHSMFGFGRRTCMGKPIAKELLFIATALWATTLERVCGEDGTEVPALHVLGKRETRKHFDLLRNLLRPLCTLGRSLFPFVIDENASL